MAAPQLVIADAAYKVYPGGVIVLRASDWLAGARGTLSTEADARSCSGTVVRDTQQVTTSIFSDEDGAFQEADDTLVIDFAAIPDIEIDMLYRVFISVLVEGDWDASDSDTYRASTNHEFLHACNLGWYGDSLFNLSDSDFASIFYRPRGRPHYVICQAGTIGDVVGDEVLHLRAYAKASTTIEWLLDQIYLLPYVTSGTHGTWRAGDFSIVGGQHNTFGVVGDFVDGADGGDANGKFTWHPPAHEDHTLFTGADGGGDYQKAADNEYMARVIAADSYYLAHTEASPDVEAAAHAYSILGSNFRSIETVVDDTFSRTVLAADKWGITPEGYAWKFLGAWEAFVDGSEGILRRTNGAGGALAYLRQWTVGMDPAALLGANVLLPSLNYSGQFRVEEPVYDGSGDFIANIFVGLNLQSADRIWVLWFDAIAQSWTLRLGQPRTLTGFTGTDSYTFHGPVDISSWFAYDGPVGFRVLKERYRLRVKVWDATGAEPGTWDFDGFLPITTTTSGVLGAGSPPANVRLYPYADDLEDAHNAMALSQVFPSVAMNGANVIAEWRSYWDDIVVAYDPLGDPGSVSGSMEMPNGTERAEIEVPYGAWQFVHWKTRDWTELDAGAPNLEFSAKVWNESGAAELQRAESPWWWFRSALAGVVSMNWSSATPVDITRVHA